MAKITINKCPCIEFCLKLGYCGQSGEDFIIEDNTCYCPWKLSLLSMYYTNIVADSERNRFIRVRKENSN